MLIAGHRCLAGQAPAAASMPERRCMRLKSKCCKRYERKGKACKHCPTMAGLSPKARRKLIKLAKK
jgi:hypothetical protein